MYPVPRFLPLGGTAVTIEFGADIEPAAQAAVRACDRAFCEERPPGIIEVVPTYRSVTVRFDPELTSANSIRRWLGTRSFIGTAAEDDREPVVIPVVYGGESGPDLEDVAALTGLTADEVIRRHSTAVYTVSMIGFLAGFPYLTGLPPELAVPRLKLPRTRVPAGSVGIAGTQAGIYPRASPGGWRLIGRTVVRLWDPTRDRPSLLEPGDRVLFRPVGLEESGPFEEAPVDVGARGKGER